MLPIYRTTLDVTTIPWNTIYSDLDKDNTKFREAINGVSTFNLNLRRDLEPWASSYRDLVTQIVHTFMPYVDAPYEQWAQMNWVNRLDDGGYASYHNHIPCDLAVVWYIQTPDNSGNFILKINNVEHVVPVATGDVIAFPAGLWHTTQPNHSGQSRMVMATNIVWTEKMRDRMRDKLSTQQLDAIYSKRQQQLIETMSEWYEINTTQTP